MFLRMDHSDTELLRAFLSDEGNDAFAQLVRRYQDMVYSTALRRTSDAGLAEEIAQDVFVLVSERAPILAGHSNLGGWLYKTTLKKAANRMKSEKRRKLREERHAEEARPTEDAAIAAPPEAFALVDEALTHLRETDREALVLRFFQDMKIGEVGSAQGSSEEATRKRIHRALDKIKAFFHRRGIAVASTTATATVLAGTTHAAPASLLPSITGAMTASAAPSALSSILIKIVTMTKLQTATLAVVVAAIPLTIQHVVLGKLEEERTALQERVAAQAPPRKQPERIGPQNTTPALASTDADAGEDAFLAMLDNEQGMQALMQMGRNLERARVNARIDRLVEAMALDEASVIAVRAHALANLEREAARQKKIFAELAENKGGALDEMTNLEPIDPLDGIEQFLTDAQAEEFKALVKAEEDAQLKAIFESLAYEELGEVQKLLD